eukprot:g743.t1
MEEGDDRYALLGHIFGRFANSTNRLTAPRAAALLSSALCGAYLPETWPVERWFSDLKAKKGTDEMDMHTFRKAFRKALGYGKDRLGPMIQSWASDRQSHVGKKTSRLIGRGLIRRVKVMTRLFCMLQNKQGERPTRDNITTNTNACSFAASIAGEANEDETTTQRGRSCDTTRPHRRRRRRPKRPPPSHWYVDQVVSVLTRKHLFWNVVRSGSGSLSLGCVVFSVGVEGFRSVDDWWRRAIVPLERFLEMPIGSILDTRAHATGKNFRHKLLWLWLKMPKGEKVSYVRFRRANVLIRGDGGGAGEGNVGIVRGLKHPVVIIGNHADLSESSERRDLACRLCHHEISHVVHLRVNDVSSRKGKMSTLQFAIQRTRTGRTLESGTTKASRAMLGGAANRAGGIVGFDEVFPPEPPRLRHTSHDRIRSPSV